ncbi:MAG: NAD(P)/FAD-dependent oxidoreductase [Alphaproteobacteria bacterium]|nr:NAD(P)/FAD-dependent oxidoreductase [Alphaproteobacteria bacterium]
MSTFHKTDVAIVGAGPVGLFSVFECGMLGMRAHAIDALPEIGGQCSALYPEKPIYDIPGLPAVSAADLIASLETQAAAFEPVYSLGQTVLKLARAGEFWRLETSAGTVVEAKAVIIAAGAGAFGPNRPPLAGIDGYEGTSVFYMVRRRDAFAGRRIVIAGGGDSAVDWALSLSHVAAKIFVVHRRARFRAAPESVTQLHRLAEAGRIELVTPFQLKALEGDGSRLSGVRVVSMEGDERLIEADTLLPFFGLANDLGPVAQWGLSVERHHVTIDPATSETSVPGIFAAGDVAGYPGKLKLILTGFAEAARAAHSAYNLVYPGRALHFEYSTSKGLPGGPPGESGVQ